MASLLKSVQKYEPCAAVDICRMVLNHALFATQDTESSYRDGTAATRANTSTAEADVNEPRVVAVTVSPAVAEIAVTMPFGWFDPGTPEMNAVPSLKPNASPIRPGSDA